MSGETTGRELRPDEAVEVLRGTEEVRRQTRAILRSAWFPPLVFGVLTLLSMSLAWNSQGVRLLYWLVAGPAGLVVVYLHFRRRRTQIGVEGPARSETVAAIVVFAVALLAAAGLGGSGRLFGLLDIPVGWGLPGLGIVFVPPLAAPIAFTAGYLVLARMERKPGLAGIVLAIGIAIVAAAIAIQTAALRAITPHGQISTLPTEGAASHLREGLLLHALPTLTYGLAFLIVGLVFRLADRSSR